MAQNKLEDQLAFANKIANSLMEETKETIQLSDKEELYDGKSQGQRKIGKFRSQNGHPIRLAQRDSRRPKKSSV